MTCTFFSNNWHGLRQRNKTHETVSRWIMHHGVPNHRQLNCLQHIAQTNRKEILEAPRSWPFMGRSLTWGHYCREHFHVKASLCLLVKTVRHRNQTDVFKENNIFCTCLVFDPNRQIGNVKWHGGMVELFLQLSEQIPRWQSSWGQHGAHLGPVGPRWAPCWPHEPSNQGMYSQRLVCALRGIQSSLINSVPIMAKTPNEMTLSGRQKFCLVHDWSRRCD